MGSPFFPTFPFAATKLNLLAVRPHLIRLADELLDSSDIRIYTAELWAKYTGAADYDQPFHRDYLNDVEEALGPPHLVSKQLTGYQPPFPNWLSRADQPAWYNFTPEASLRQLLLFGFPPPGHEFWTQQTLKYVGQRYPGLDVTTFLG